MESWLHITITCNFYLQIRGFSGGSDDKESACNAGDLNFDPWVRKIPWRGNDSPLQYSCLENPMDRGALRATVREVTKSWT